MITTCVPVILAGGSGTRLWPLSRKNFPKQFLCLQGQHSLLQQTFLRTLELQSEKTLVITNDAHYFLCQEQLDAVRHSASLTYLLEPCPRNTAPAIAAAAQHLVAQGMPDAVMLILPSDHFIEDTQAWQEAMAQGCQYAKAHDAIVTFGITPDGPKTGYGYIQTGEACEPGLYRVNAFKEKPNEAAALKMIADGQHVWNSGMFASRASVLLKELSAFAPSIVEKTQNALCGAHAHHDFLRLDEDAFGFALSESIDYAVMEHTKKAVVIPISVRWSDLGCWTSVANANQADEHGNTLQGNVLAKDSNNCLIKSTGALVTTLGIDNQIIVATQDAVLVADKRYSQQVKDMVAHVGQHHQQLLEDHPRVSRPWGYFEVLAEGASFKVKRLMVKPGAKLSLQRHAHRAEHWVVVGGQALVVNDNDTLTLCVNQSTYIPQKAMHRLSNPYDEPLYVIEVQSGDYLGEDDIERFDDAYLRKLSSEVI